MSATLQSAARWESSYLAFISQQLFSRPPSISSSLAGQTALLTGANTGLGYEAARQLLRLGLSHLILAVRSPTTKGAAAAAQLSAEFPAARIDVWALDMADYPSIQAFAERCAEKLPTQHLDIVILNAAVQTNDLTHVEATGYETTFQVNYLSTALLAALLLPVLRRKRPATHPARMVVIDSDTQYWAKFDAGKGAGPIFPRVGKPAPREWDGLNQYSVSKLLLTGFVTKLAALVSPDEVIVSLANPGLTKGTALTGSGAAVMIKVLAMCVGRSVEVSASTYVDAVVNHGPESHGSFLSNWAIKPFPMIYYTKEGEGMRDRLWDETIGELDFAGISAVVAELKSACEKPGLD